MKKNKTARMAAKVAAPAKEGATAPKAKTTSTVAAPADAEKKVKKVSSVKVKEVNAAQVAAKITKEKELKYIYPQDCQEDEGADKVELLERRKKFRAGVRRTLASYGKKLGNLAKSNLPEDFVLWKKVRKELDTYEKSVLVNPILTLTDKQ